MMKNLVWIVALLAGCSSQPPKVEPLPASPQVVKFTATPAKLDAAGPVTLTWETKDATEVALIDGAGAAVPGVDNRASGTVTVTVDKNMLFVLRATNARGVADSAAAYVELAGAPGELFFAASPDTISAGEAAVLAWSATGAKTVKITDAAGVAVDLKGQATFGTVQVQPDRDTTYTIDADGLTATAKIVVRPRITLFATAPAYAKPGGTVVLSWKTAGATKVTIEGAVRGVLKTETDAAKVADGSFTDPIPNTTSPSEVFRYRLIAESGAGITTSQEVTVYVSDVPLIVEFLAPKYAEIGANTRLSWKTTAERVEISVANTVIYRSPSAAVAATGFVDLPTAVIETEYTLTASNLRGGAATQKRTVDAVNPITTTMFTASPQPGIANGGDPVTLTWAVPNARFSKLEAKNQYPIDERSGQAAQAGSLVVYPNAPTTEYVLTVSNGVGAPVTLSQFVTVTTEANFTYSQGAVPTGATIQLTGSTIADAGTVVTGLPKVESNVPGDVFVDISNDGTSIAYSGPDTTAKLVTLPETFSTLIYGEKVSGNKLSISINGWFIFNATTVSGADDNDVPLPSTALEPLAIAPWWDDLYDVADSEIFYRLDGLGADRRLIVQWDGVEHDDFPGSTLTFQAQVFASGKIVFAYQTITGVTTVDPSVGVVSAGEYDAIVAPTAPVQGSSFTFFGPQTIPFPFKVIPLPQIARLSMPNNSFIELRAAPPVLAPNQFALSEVHFNPAAAVTNGQWLEIESKATTPIDLQGWTIDFGGGVTHAIASSLVLPGNGRVLLGQSATGGDGLAVDYVYGPAISAAATGGTAKITLAGANYSSLLWDPLLAKQGSAVQADGVGRPGVIYATGVTGISCASTGTFGTNGQRGTPKLANTACPPFVRTSIPGAFLPIAAIGTAIPLTTPTEENVTLTLPDPIEVGGSRNAVITVSTNGYVALGTLPCATAANCYNVNRTATTLNPALAPFGLIAPFWDNVQPNVAGGIYRHRLDPDLTPGTGDELTIISWEDFKPSLGTGALNFQVKFFDNGNIEFHYGAMASTTSSNAQGSSATVWLEEPLGRAAIPVSINSSTTPGIAANSGVLFTRQ